MTIAQRLARLFPLSLALVAFPLITSACSDTPEVVLEPRYKIYLGGDFPPMPVDEAMSAWAIATDGEVSWEIIRNNCHPGANVICISWDQLSYEPWLGGTSRYDELNYSIITINPHKPYDSFATTLKHELGHAFGLQHSDCGIMRPIIGNLDPIEECDVIAFRREWKL